MKKYFVFEKKSDVLTLLGTNKDEFIDYIDNNVDDIIKWRPHEIEETLENGDCSNDHPLVLELLDNANEWAYCWGDAENIIYTQKTFENEDFLSCDFYDFVVYFKEFNLLNDDEKKLIQNI